MKPRWQGLLRRGIVLTLPLALTLAALAEPEQRVERFERDGVELTMKARPGAVALGRDLEVVFELTHPAALAVTIPDKFDDRFEGFSIEGSYESDTTVAGGRQSRAIHLRERPLPAAPRYRIAPFAVQAEGFWFATKPLVFELVPLLGEDEAVPTRVEVDLKPVWIRPTWRTVLRWAGVGLGVLLMLGLLLRVVRLLRRRVMLARMAPRERALLELRELLDRDLPGRGRVKEFYVALTFVVRWYIERRYRLRAPGQTTEEFLLAAVQHPAFDEQTLTRLREFLASADLIKFAGVEATPEAIAASVGSARAYLENEPSGEDAGTAAEVAR